MYDYRFLALKNNVNVYADLLQGLIIIFNYVEKNKQRGTSLISNLNQKFMCTNHYLLVL